MNRLLQITMIPLTRLISITFLLTLIISGCSASGDQPKNVEQHLETEATPNSSSWALLFKEEITQPMRVAAFLNPDYGITGGPSDAGKAYRTTDGGQSWAKSESSTDCLFALDLPDPQVAWQCSLGPISRSTDGGQSWETVSNYGNYCKYLSFLDATTGWVAAPDRLGFTNDGGQSWQTLPLPAGADEILAVSLHTPTDGYLLDANSRLHITADGGQSWQKHALEVGDYTISNHDTASASLRFTDDEHGVIVMHVSSNSQSKVIAFYTGDGGHTWEQEDIVDTSLLVSLYLSPDGKLLTIADMIETEVTLLHHASEIE